MDWKQVAENLASFAGEQWLPSQTRERVDSFDHLFIACSGGADSVFLALYFGQRFLAGGMAASLAVLHFNHQLRGKESEKDQRFTEELCEGLGIDCKTGSWERSDKPKPVSEEAARDARMAFFGDALGENRERSAILTGHHGDDIAETMLMRLSRGSGLQGLTAPREYSKGANGLRFIRPLLGMGKGAIVTCLKEAGASWREDQSNQEGIYYRNRLRKFVIPAWENAADRPIRGGIAQSRALLEEDWLAIEQLFEGSWKSARLESGALEWRQVLEMPRAFQRRALSRIVSEAGANVLALAPMESVLASLKSERGFRISLEKDVWLCGSEQSGEIELMRSSRNFEWSPVRLPLGTSLYLPTGGVIRAREIDLDSDRIDRILSGFYSHEETVFLGADGKDEGLIGIRSRKAGDAYRPLGRQSSVKLKELFIDRKVLRETKSMLPIVVDSNDNILWAPGLPPSFGRRIEKQTTRALQLTYGK